MCGACGAVGVGVGRCQCAHACVHVAVLAVLPVCTHAGAAAGAQQQRPGAQQLRPEGTSSHRPAASACSAHVIRPACSNGPARYPRGLPTEPPHGLQSQPDLCGCASFAYTNVVALCPLPLSLFPFLARATAHVHAFALRSYRRDIYSKDTLLRRGTLNPTTICPPAGKWRRQDLAGADPLGFQQRRSNFLRPGPRCKGEHQREGGSVRACVHARGCKMCVCVCQ